MSRGERLDTESRTFFEPRFGADFSSVRLHRGSAASALTDSTGALALTVGQHIFMGACTGSMARSAHQRLIAHELAHTIQQGEAMPPPGRPLPFSGNADERAADRAAEAVLAGRVPGPLAHRPMTLARQPKPDKPGQKEEETEEVPDEIPVANGTLVSKIVIDLRRGRVGFVVPGPKFMILGHVGTDLRPGRYTVTADFHRRQWIFEGGQVKVGVRFDLTLEGADPWNLAYPEKLPVVVGMSAEKKGTATAGETAADTDADFVRMWDETAAMGDIKEDPTIDGFVDWVYDATPDASGKFSTRITLRYSDGSEESLDLSVIDETSTADPPAGATMRKTGSGRDLPAVLNRKTAPNLSDVKRAVKRIQETLLRQWDAELLSKELEKFPEVFSVLAQVAVIGANAKSFEITGSPAGRGAASRSVAAAAKIKPFNGIVNVGGGLEEGAAQATNLNPIVRGTGGPTSGIPNHVKAGFEQIAEVFEEGSVDKIISRKLPSTTVNWEQAAQGSYKVLKPGGKVALNVWQHGTEDSAAIKAAFEKAGFKDVKVAGEGSSVVIATK